MSSPKASPFSFVLQLLVAAREGLSQDEAGGEGAEHHVELEDSSASTLSATRSSTVSRTVVCAVVSEPGPDQEHDLGGVLPDPPPRQGDGSGDESEHDDRHNRLTSAAGAEQDRHGDDRTELAAGAVVHHRLAHRGAEQPTVLHDRQQGAQGRRAERDGDGDLGVDHAEQTGEEHQDQGEGEAEPPRLPGPVDRIVRSAPPARSRSRPAGRASPRPSSRRRPIASSVCGQTEPEGSDRPPAINRITTSGTSFRGISPATSGAITRAQGDPEQREERRLHTQPPRSPQRRRHSSGPLRLVCALRPGLIRRNDARRPWCRRTRGVGCRPTGAWHTL